MSLYIACECGRAVAVPEGHAAPAITCPDCNRTVPLDGGPAAAPPRPSLRRVLIPDWAFFGGLTALVVLLVAVPGLAKALGALVLACCVAPAVGLALAGWWQVRRIRRHLEEVER